MTDIDILLLGCGVSFIAAAGAYVFIRERFTAGQEASPKPVPIEKNEDRKPRRAA